MKSSQNSQNSRWLAGAAQMSITPDESVFLFGYPHVERMSTGVHDPLLTSALALSDGRATVLLIANDIIWVPRAIADSARRRIAEATDVAVDHIMITGTHTHSGPVPVRIASNLNDPVVPEPDPAYCRLLEDRIVEAGIAAQRNLEPATLLHAVADGSGLGSNRHDPAGPAIPQTPVLLARRVADDSPIALMCVCSMHPTVLHEDSTVISGDFPGLARRHLQAGPLTAGCPVVYHMGASGNQSPRHVVRENTMAETDRLGKLLADAIVAALRSATAIEPARLSAASHRIDDLPVRRFPATDRAEREVRVAHERLAQLRHWHAPPGEIRGAEVDCFGAEETLTLSKLAAQGGLQRFVESCLPAEVQVFRVGPHALVGWPGEVFVEFALDLMSRHGDVSVITLANGDLQGYVVTQEAIDRGSYEAGNALFQSPAAGEILVEATERLLRDRADDR